MVVKKKRRDINDLGDLGIPDAPSFDDIDGPDTDIGMPSSGGGMASPESVLERLSSEAVSALIKDGIPPIPTNFQLYFDRLLEELPQETQAEIKTMLEMEDTNTDEQALALEQKIKNAFRSIKQLLQVSSNLYKNMTLMSRILAKRKNEFSG